MNVGRYKKQCEAPFLTNVALIVLICLAVFRIDSAMAGPACRDAGGSGGAINSPDTFKLIPKKGYKVEVSYQHGIGVDACQYGSGDQATCVLHTREIKLVRSLRIWNPRPAKTYEHTRSWTLPQMSKDGFAKGHDCNRLVHDLESTKFAESIRHNNAFWQPIIDADRAEVNQLLSTYP